MAAAGAIVQKNASHSHRCSCACRRWRWRSRPAANAAASRRASTDTGRKIAGTVAAVALILHANPRSSNAQKVRFLLGELGLVAEIREVPFGVERPQWHLAVNPVGGIPALVDGDLHLAESHAILRYLAAREGRTDLYPADLAERARVDWVLDGIATTVREVTRPFD